MKSLLVFDHPCFSSLNLFNLPYPFEDGGIRILHKIYIYILHIMDSDVIVTFSVSLVTMPLSALFSTNVFTDMTTATWNPASDLLMIKLLVE